MTDDVGFAAPSTFGGMIPTPALDRIAKMGLRYTQFHSTALCSPTRAALITGRNHHSVGFGNVSELATGFPGYDSVIEKANGTVGEILKQNGYATSWFGKNHNTPAFAASQAGPFDQWPIGMGFEYFYGFIGGDASQWQPNLFRNTTAIYPYVGQSGWNLNTAMADDAIQYMKHLNELAPEKPFFVYYVPGATHAPHHPTPEWIKKISDMHLFDKGWNALRETIFENQKKLGVIPANAKLTARPKDLPKWDTLSFEEKKLFMRQVDVYAAYLAYADHEIGRVIQAVEDMGKLDNTLIIYISGDNGASAEGTLNGTPNEVAPLNRVEILGNRAIYHDGWVAATTPVTVPWHMTATVPDVITGYKWELYDMRSDPTEADDLAAKMPDKVKEMQALFLAEAKKYNVLPLDNSTLTRIIAPRPSVAAGRKVFTYSGEHAGIPNGSEPSILQRSYTITAEVTIPEGGAEGMIVTQGGRFAGYGFYLSKGELGVGRGKPVFLYNFLDVKRTTWEGPE